MTRLPGAVTAIYGVSISGHDIGSPSDPQLVTNLNVSGNTLNGGGVTNIATATGTSAARPSVSEHWEVTRRWHLGGPVHQRLPGIASCHAHYESIPEMAEETMPASLVFIIVSDVAPKQPAGPPPTTNARRRMGVRLAMNQPHHQTKGIVETLGAWPPSTVATLTG